MGCPSFQRGPDRQIPRLPSFPMSADWQIRGCPSSQKGRLTNLRLPSFPSYPLPKFDNPCIDLRNLSSHNIIVGFEVSCKKHWLGGLKSLKGLNMNSPGWQPGVGAGSVTTLTGLNLDAMTTELSCQSNVVQPLQGWFKKLPNPGAIQIKALRAFGW